MPWVRIPAGELGKQKERKLPFFSSVADHQETISKLHFFLIFLKRYAQFDKLCRLKKTQFFFPKFLSFFESDEDFYPKKKSVEEKKERKDFFGQKSLFFLSSPLLLFFEYRAPATKWFLSLFSTYLKILHNRFSQFQNSCKSLTIVQV